MTNSNLLRLEDLFSIIQRKAKTAEKNSYTFELTQGGVEKISRKVGEEAIEVVVAAFMNDKKNDEKTKQELIGEICDLFYHTLVLMNERNIEYNDILNELTKRNK